MEELLKAVKNSQDITWNDTALDEKLSGIIQRGKSYLDRIAGERLDYAEGTKGRELLLEYARYARANAIQDFAGDFTTELNALHADGEVGRFESEYPELS